MRIAIFTDTYLPDKNGVSMSIDNFTRLMADDGNQIMIFCPKGRKLKSKEYPNIEVKRYPSISFPTYKAMQLSFPSIWKITRDLKNFNADVVHIQTPMGIGLAGIWATKILKLKNIQTYHTYIPDFVVYVSPKTIFGINKLTNYISNSKLAKALTLNHDFSEEEQSFVKFKSHLEKMVKEIASNNHIHNDKVNEKIGGQYTRAIYNRANLVLTPSKAMKNLLKKQGIRPKVEVMSNGVDYDFFKKKTNYHVANKIVYTGRLGFEKNVDVVVRAFAIAQKSNSKLRLDIYGDGPAKKSLQHLAKTLEVDKKIKFWGAYDINKLSKTLCQYDFFVTASTIETQGIVILEAMAAGLPVLGVKKLAVPEVVANGKNGYLSAPSNFEEMAKNMLKLLESDDKLELFGKNSLKIADSHEVTKCKDRLFKIYQKVSNKK